MPLLEPSQLVIVFEPAAGTWVARAAAYDRSVYRSPVGRFVDQLVRSTHLGDPATSPIEGIVPISLVIRGRRSRRTSTVLVQAKITWNPLHGDQPRSRAIMAVAPLVDARYPRPTRALVAADEARQVPLVRDR